MPDFHVSTEGGYAIAENSIGRIGIDLQWLLAVRLERPGVRRAETGKQYDQRGRKPD